MVRLIALRLRCEFAILGGSKGGLDASQEFLVWVPWPATSVAATFGPRRGCSACGFAARSTAHGTRMLIEMRISHDNEVAMPQWP